MPARPRMTLALAAGWFCLLAVLIAGPLLGRGYLLLLDYPSGPHFPDFSVFPLPSSGDVGNGVPLYALHTALRELVTTLPDKLYLIAPVVLGGIGVYRLVRRRLDVSALAAVYGGTLFVVNPFTYDRYLAGHLFFLLGYSLLPWALAPLFDLVQTSSRRAAVVSGIWIIVLGAISLHVAGMYVLLVLVAALVTWSRLGLALGAVAVLVGALASAYWLLPAVFSRPGPNVGAADLTVYESRPRGYAVLPTLIGMDGFWRDEFTTGPERHPALYLLLIPVLGLAVLGAVNLVARHDVGRFAIVLSVAAIAGLSLAAGSSFPGTGEAFRWFYAHLPLFGAYREPQKFLALVVLGYAVFGAAGLGTIVRSTTRRIRTLTALAAAAATTIALGYGYPIFWGFAGQVQLSRYPSEWSAANRIMATRGEGRLLVFPWHLYAVWSFSDGRIVANPARSFFSREVLAGDEAGFKSVAPQSPDPFSRYVANLLTHRAKVRALGHLVAPLGVRFVAWMREADWWQYQFLSRQSDLVPVYRGDGIVLFENRAWRGEVLGLADEAAIASPSELFGSRQEREAARRLYSSPSLVYRVDGGLPLLARSLPGARRVTPGRREFVATTDRCSDGWRLSDEKASCDLGAVAAFPVPKVKKALWRPLAGVQLLGYAFSGLTFAALAVYLARSSRVRAKLPPRDC
jgi:hypothetical protein